MDDQDEDKQAQMDIQQSNKMMLLMQQLLAKQDLLLDENKKIKQEMAIQQITINNLTQTIEAIQVSNGLCHNVLPTKTSSLTTAPLWQSTSNKCDQVQLDDAQRLSVVIDLLKGNAKLWYDTYKDTIHDWVTLKNKLTTYFKLVTGTDHFQLEQKVYNRRRQTNELAIDYCHNVLRLCSKVNRYMDDETRLKHLTKGLNAAAQLHMDLKSPATSEEFLQALIKYDKWQEEEKNQVRATLSFDNRRHIATTTTQQPFIQQEPYSSIPQQQYNSPQQQYNNSPQQQYNNSSQQPRHQQYYTTHASHQPQYNNRGVCDGHTSFPQSHPSLIIIGTIVNGTLIHAMLDTGATTSLISQTEFDLITHPPIQQIPTTALLGDGQIKIIVNGAVELTITINDITTTITALIVDSLGANLILGMDWCKSNSVNVNIGKKQVEINHPKYGITATPFLDSGSVDVRLTECITLLPHHEHIVKMYVPISSANLVSFLPDIKTCAKLNVQVSDAFVEIKDFSFYVCIYNPNKNIYKLTSTVKLGSVHYQSNDEMMYSILNTDKQSSMTKQSTHLNSIQTNEQQESSKSSLLENILQELVMHIDDKHKRNDFLNILRQNKRSFDNSKMTRAKTKIYHTINAGDLLPTSVRPYYKTVQQRKEVQQEVGMLLDQGILRPSNSPWSSPVLLKKKPDGMYRFLVDFRRLNSIIKKDSYPQPSAEELLHRLVGHQYFTKLDLNSGYFQIPIHESDIPKTAIITQDGLYEFTVLAQGLMNAPPTFQRVMNELLANGRWDCVVVYLDDIVIFSKTIEEHKQHVADVISTLHKANFQVSPAKCSIAVKKIEFLSHIVTSDKVEPSLDKIKAIVNIAPPKTLSQANKFIGKVGYYRKFIRDFAKIAAPIHKVTNKTPK
ncbi:unnamed protein product [Rotaria magnacalcarata]